MPPDPMPVSASPTSSGGFPRSIRKESTPKVELSEKDLHDKVCLWNLVGGGGYPLLLALD
jgi:hypothetical protein